MEAFPGSDPASGRGREDRPCPYGTQTKTEQHLASADNVDVFVGHLRPEHPSRGAVILLHGAGSPSSSLWDLPGEYSFMRKLACQGFEAFSLDVRGFGGSSPPPPDSRGQPEPVRALDAVRDLAVAANWARAESGHPRVDLFAWSWGSVVAGHYAGRPQAPVRRLVLFGPVWDRRWASRHVNKPKWQTIQRDDLLKYFDPRRESRSILEAHVDAMFRFASREGLQLSNGPYMDIYGDAPTWDPSLVRAPTLIVRGESDRASQQAAVYRLFLQLNRAASRRLVVLGGAGHFAFRTYRHAALSETVINYLSLPDEAL